MSRMTVIACGKRGFWVWDDVFSVWLAYVVEEIDRSNGDTWLVAIADKWRVASVATDSGAEVPARSAEQMAALRSMAVLARRRAERAGDLSLDALRSWHVMDDEPVAGGFSRTGDQVELVRILEVADAFIDLLDGHLRRDPPEGAWLVGTGGGYVVVPYNEAPLADDAPRFHTSAG